MKKTAAINFNCRVLVHLYKVWSSAVQKHLQELNAKTESESNCKPKKLNYWNWEAISSHSDSKYILGNFSQLLELFISKTETEALGKTMKWNQQQSNINLFNIF